jgi:SAM-dependent methyltransferase
MPNTSNDLAGAGYWNSIWQRSESRLPMNPHDRSIGNYVARQLHEFLSQAVRQATPVPVTQGGDAVRVLELGCGNSPYLPYFAREFSADVYGIDYSSNGCEAAVEICQRAGVPIGRIWSGDLFDPLDFSASWGSAVDSFDVVFSLGLVEHFTDTAGVLRAAARYLKPGGTMISVIPNFGKGSLSGWLQKRLNREVYEKHVPLTLAKLHEAHVHANLVPTLAAWVCVFNFGVVNLGDLPARRVGRSALEKWGHRFSMALGWTHEHTRLMRPNRFISPYIGVAARELS